MHGRCYLCQVLSGNGSWLQAWHPVHDLQHSPVARLSLLDGAAGMPAPASSCTNISLAACAWCLQVGLGPWWEAGAKVESSFDLKTLIIIEVRCSSTACVAGIHSKRSCRQRGRRQHVLGFRANSSTPVHEDCNNS